LTQLNGALLTLPIALPTALNEQLIAGLRLVPANGGQVVVGHGGGGGGGEGGGDGGSSK
jgi:hypothetical protein